MGITFDNQSKYKAKPKYFPPKYLAEEEVEELHDIAFYSRTKADFRLSAQLKGFSKKQIDEYLFLFGSE